MKSLRVVSSLVVVLLAVAVSACGGGGDTAGAAGGGGKSDEPIVVGLSNSSVDSVWRPQMLKDFEAEAKKMQSEGKIKDYMLQSADGTAPMQAQQIQGMVNQGANLILIDSASATAFNGLINQITAKGVTVVSFDNPVTSEKSTNLYQDEEKISAETATRIGELAGEKGTIVMMNGTAGAPLSDAREKLAEAALKQFPDVKVVKAYADWNGAKAKQKMATILANEDDITGVWTQGSMAPSIVSAFEDAGKEIPPIVGDGLGGFLEKWDELKQERDYETVGIVVSPKIVLDALWTGVKLRDGWTMKEKNTVLSHPLITNDTLDEYLKLGTPAGSHVDVPIVPEDELYEKHMNPPAS